MLERLKNLDLDRLSVDEAIALLAFGKSLRAEYETMGVDVPEWLESRLRELAREIRARSQDQIEKRIKELKARSEALKPTETKRRELREEIKELEKKLQGVA